MTLYIQDENYHFNGSLSGVIVDNQRTAIFSKNGIEDLNLDIDFNKHFKIKTDSKYSLKVTKLVLLESALSELVLALLKNFWNLLRIMLADIAFCSIFIIGLIIV